MKIAFYLGSFNPFHNGHYKLIETVLSENMVDKVVIVPTMNNPWKYNKVLDFYNRGNLISLSIVDLLNKDYNISIDYIEKDLDFPYYSITTLNALKTKYSLAGDNELFLLCTKDTLDSIRSLKDGDKILTEWNIISLDKPEGTLTSSEIRQLVKECKDISPYVHKRIVKMVKRYYFYDV